MLSAAISQASAVTTLSRVLLRIWLASRLITTQAIDRSTATPSR